MKARDLREAIRNTPQLKAVFRLNSVPAWMRALAPHLLKPIEAGEYFYSDGHGFCRMLYKSYYSIPSRYLTFVGHQDVSKL